MGSLESTVAVITGASSGIGAALAKAFSEAGARVALLARRRDRLEEIAAGCPGETLIITGDVTRPEDRASLVIRTEEAFGGVDVLVNNAGLGAFGSFLETTEDQWRELFEINMFAPMMLTRAVLPAMIERGRGLILNIASIGGLLAHSDKVSPYVSSKHALIGFSRGLVKDLEGTGVRIKAVCPHLTSTEFFDTGPGADEMGPEAEKYREFMDTPEEVAVGILEGLDEDGLILFPTPKPARAYARMKDI